MKLMCKRMLAAEAQVIMKAEALLRGKILSSVGSKNVKERSFRDHGFVDLFVYQFAKCFVVGGLYYFLGRIGKSDR